MNDVYAESAVGRDELWIENIQRRRTDAEKAATTPPPVTAVRLRTSTTMSLLNELQCPVCNKLLAFPTTRPCGHSVCYECDKEGECPKCGDYQDNALLPFPVLLLDEYICRKVEDYVDKGKDLPFGTDAEEWKASRNKSKLTWNELFKEDKAAKELQLPPLRGGHQGGGNNDNSEADSQGSDEGENTEAQPEVSTRSLQAKMVPFEDSEVFEKIKTELKKSDGGIFGEDARRRFERMECTKARVKQVTMKRMRASRSLPLSSSG